LTSYLVVAADMLLPKQLLPLLSFYPM